MLILTPNMSTTYGLRMGFVVDESAADEYSSCGCLPKKIPTSTGTRPWLTSDQRPGTTNFWVLSTFLFACEHEDIGCLLSETCSLVLDYPSLDALGRRIRGAEIGSARPPSIRSALTTPSALRVVVDLFPDQRSHDRAIAVFGGTGGVGNVLGLIIGALLV